MMRIVVLISLVVLLAALGTASAAEPEIAEKIKKDFLPIAHESNPKLAKVDPALLREMSKNKPEEVKVIIMLKGQPSAKPFTIHGAKTLMERTQKDLMRALKSMRAKNIKQHWIINAISATVPSERVLKIAERRDVAGIWLDRKLSLPEPVKPSGYKNATAGQFYFQPDYGDYAIGAPDLWKLGYTGQNVKIAVLDTGIDRTHPMLDDLDDNPATNDPKVIAEACFTDEGYTTDGNGHGTHVAAIAAGTRQDFPRLNGSYAWYSGTGDYLDNTLDYEFNLTGVSSANLTFSTWYWTEEGYDYCYVKISTDGVNWITLDYFTGYSGTNELINRVYSLTPYVGNNIIVRFEYVTDYSIHYAGWFVDDIAVPEIGFYDDVESGGNASNFSGWTVSGPMNVSGVAPGALLMNGKVLTDDGEGWTSWIISGIEWAVDNGADVISMSLGGWPWDDRTGRDPLSLAVENARNAGKIVVVAAGNDGPGEGTVSSPAVSRGAISVAASDRFDATTDFSSRGPTGDGRIGVDIAAPGEGILSAVPASGAVYSNPSGYDVFSGTSMACPHVSGAVALLLSAGAGVDEVEKILKNGADQIRSPYSDVLALAEGAGRINVSKAYELLTGCTVDEEWYIGRVAPGTYSKTFTVVNNGTADVTLEISCSPMYTAWNESAGNWMSSDTVLTVPAGGTATFTVTMDIPSDAAGIYVGWIKAGDALIPVSVDVVKEVFSNGIYEMNGYSDEQKWYSYWLLEGEEPGEAFYYTLDIKPGVSSIRFGIDYFDVFDNYFCYTVFNPDGQFVTWGDYWDDATVDNPAPGRWTVVVYSWIYEPASFTLTAVTTGSDVLEVAAFTANPGSVSHSDTVEFSVNLNNKLTNYLDAYVYIDIYQVTANGLIHSGSVDGYEYLKPGLNPLVYYWYVYPSVTPGSYMAQLTVYYGDYNYNNRVAEGNTTFAVLPDSQVIVLDNESNPRTSFAPGESVYIAAHNLLPNATYAVWIQPDPVLESQLLDPDLDPSGHQEIVTTDENGNVSPTLIWSIPASAAPTHEKWDVVLDLQSTGAGRFNGDYDGIASVQTYGIIAPIPELSTAVLAASGLLATLAIAVRRH